MKVRCIHGSRLGVLISGQVYEVKNQDAAYYYVVDGSGGWLKERFEIVDDGTPTTTLSSSPPTTNKYAGKECPCGMPSDQCDYHRGT